MSTADGHYGDVTVMVVAAIIFFVMAVIFAIFICIFVKMHWGSRSTSMAFGNGAEDGHPDVVLRRLGRGLDSSILNKIPVTVHRTSDGEGCEAMECAVCLSEVADGENIRMLPGCKHGFHVECIDKWFHSHSTCPLCRHPLATPVGGISTEDYTPEVPDFPTDVLFSGSRREVLVIDVPGRVIDEMATSSTSTSSSSSSSSPAPRGLPAATPQRLRSFTRLFSMGRRAVGETSSDGDIERGEEKTS